MADHRLVGKRVRAQLCNTASVKREWYGPIFTGTIKEYNGSHWVGEMQAYYLVTRDDTGLDVWLRSFEFKFIKG